METELRVNVAGGVAAVGQTEADGRLRRLGRTSALAISTSFDPALHRLRHSNPVIHQLEEEEEKDLSLTPPTLKSFQFLVSRPSRLLC